VIKIFVGFRCVDLGRAFDLRLEYRNGSRARRAICSLRSIVVELRFSGHLPRILDAVYFSRFCFFTGFGLYGLLSARFLRNPMSRPLCLFRIVGRRRAGGAPQGDFGVIEIFEGFRFVDLGRAFDLRLKLP
jgi:hypothetical protein